MREKNRINKPNKIIFNIIDKNENNEGSIMFSFLIFKKVLLYENF